MRNAGLFAFQAVSEQAEDPHHPVHLQSSIHTLAVPSFVFAQARSLVLSHSPLFPCKWLWFSTVSEPLCHFPDMRWSHFCPCYWCAPHRPFLHPSLHCALLCRSMLPWILQGWALPTVLKQWKWNECYCKTTGEMFDMLLASEDWSLKTWFFPHFIHKIVLINVGCKPVHLVYHCLSFAPASFPNNVAQCRW